MVFSSYEFIFVFLPVTLLVFFSIPENFASLWIVIASLFFYAYWNIYYLPLLILSVGVNYIVSRKIESSTHKKFWFISGIIFNFLLLGYFKFTGFLPLGISFFTFTQTAYIIEIYRQNTRTASFLQYSEYAIFFPYITSGPIADYKAMLPQFESIRNFAPNYENIARGIVLFALGLFKKVCIADYLAPAINNLFANSEMLTFFDAWAAALGYSVQLYFDFSGYSDMAIAIGLMFNIKIPENFNSPYKSLSIIDFWRRWHITLSTWIRNYIYIPLGGNRHGELKKMRNIFVAMLFTGLWHGTGWTFILWGGLHGLMLIINHQWRRLNIKLPAVISWAITFICVVLCWVIFRAENIHDALNIISAMFNFSNIIFPARAFVYLKFLGLPENLFALLLLDARIFLSVILLTPSVILLPNTREIIAHFKPGILWLLFAMIVSFISLINLSGIQDFLYFQF